MGEKYGGSTVTEIKERLFRYVWGQMRIHGERKPPLIKTPEKSDFIKSRKAKIIYRNMEKIEGYLDVRGNKIFIFIRESLRKKPLQLRTVIAHELGHTFLLNTESNPIKPYYPTSWSMQKRWEEIEGLAFEIGRHILVPDLLLRASINQHSLSSPSLESFNELKRRFKVTTHIMARRLIHDLKLWDAYLFISEFDTKCRSFRVPKNVNRFKSEKSFKNFRLNKYWTRIQEFLVKYLDNRVEEPVFVKFGRKVYRNEMEIAKNSRWALCLLIPVGSKKV